MSSTPSAPFQDPAIALLQQANLTLMNTMNSYFQGKQQKPDEESDKDDEPATNKPAKFTARKAAPFHGWAGFRPSHLFKKLPCLFGDLVEASSSE
jgi:hypothetical protein